MFLCDLGWKHWEILHKLQELGTRNIQGHSIIVGILTLTNNFIKFSDVSYNKYNKDGMN
jgi:hypothetical protein